MKQSQSKPNQAFAKEIRLVNSKPLLVYVSGAPGSGKTTLAEQLSKELYIPHVSSDLIHGGVRLSLGAPNDRKRTLQDVFVPLLINMIKMKISVVADHVLQKGVSEEDVINRLHDFAVIIYVHTQSEHSIERFYKREKARTDRNITMSPEELQARKTYHARNLSKTEKPLNFDAPCIVVDTDSGYEPELEKVISFIEAEYERGNHR